MNRDTISTNPAGKRAAAARDGRLAKAETATVMLTTGQHTPGPWVAEYDETAIGDGLVTACRGNLTVCEVHDHGEGSEQHDHDEFKANASLIAAAPEMLEALLIAMAYVDDVLDNPEQLACFKAGVVQAHAKSIRAAIAKATGSKA